MQTEVEISVVVPVYNSADILPELIKRIEGAMNKIAKPYEIILTDDYSTDNTWNTIKTIAAKHNGIRGLRLSENCRQWRSTLFGMSKAKGKYIVTIDDDLEYEPYEIVKLYEAILNNKFEVVFGLPLNKYALQGKNQKLSMLRKLLMHKIWNSPVTDSFRIMKRNLVFEGDRFKPKMFIDAFITTSVDKKLIGYVQTLSNKRFSGSSNVNLLLRVKLFSLYFLQFSKLNSNKQLITAVWLATGTGLFFLIFSKAVNTFIYAAVLSILSVAFPLLTLIIFIDDESISFRKSAFITDEIDSACKD